MKYRYAVHTNNGKQKGENRSGRYVDPSRWVTGPDPLRHEKYYAWLKHRSQANYRKEEYSLTWEQWEELWSDERWFSRGRTIESLCLQQIEPGEGWHISNVEVVTRRKHFADKKERNRAKQ